MRLARKRLPSSVSSAMNSKPPAMAGKFGRFWAAVLAVLAVLPINLHALTKCFLHTWRSSRCFGMLWASFEHIRTIAERFRKQSWLSFLNTRWHIASPRPSSSSSIVFAVGVPTGRKRSSHPAGVGFCSMGVFIPKRSDPSMKVDDHCCTKRTSKRPGPTIPRTWFGNWFISWASKRKWNLLKLASFDLHLNSVSHRLRYFV